MTAINNLTCVRTTRPSGRLDGSLFSRSYANLAVQGVHHASKALVVVVTGLSHELHKGRANLVGKKVEIKQGNSQYGMFVARQHAMKQQPQCGPLALCHAGTPCTLSPYWLRMA